MVIAISKTRNHTFRSIDLQKVLNAFIANKMCYFMDVNVLMLIYVILLFIFLILWIK
jgi:hypothetical protein